MEAVLVVTWLLLWAEVSPEKDDFYADVLIYGTGCVLFILAVVIVVLIRMRMTAQKTLPTPPVQKLSKFPLKRQVTESRYKICKAPPPTPPPCLLPPSERTSDSPTIKLRFCSRDRLHAVTRSLHWRGWNSLNSWKTFSFLQFIGGTHNLSIWT